MNWTKRDSDESLLSPRPMPQAIWNICRARGLVTEDELNSFFSPRLADISNPQQLHQLDIAVERLVQARKSGEPVGIYGDFDLDGTPGIVLLEEAFQSLGLNVQSVFQPSRREDGYGLHANRLIEMHAAGIRLVVTVDVGITDLEAVSAANKVGLDVIITDHHLPKSELPKALAIVNPNKGSCTSNLQHLCGTGVAFYLVLGLRSALRERNLLDSDFDPKRLLDLFALATISDQVPLIKENRVLVKHGLRELSRGSRPGLQMLLKALGLSGRQLNSKDVAFRIAPKLNALTRLEEGISAREVLISRDAREAEQKVALALEINRRRVEYQKTASVLAKTMITESSPFVWVYSHEFHPGVISLLASQIAEEHGVPAFVGTKDVNGMIKGSARSPHEGFHLQQILGQTADALEKFGGHAFAAGFSLHQDNAQSFADLLAEAVSQAEVTARSRTLEYDTEIDISELTPEFMRWYEEMGPFGQGFESPIFRMNSLRVDEVKELKGGYFKYSLSKNGLTFKAPWFNNPQRFEKGSLIDILFEPQWNEFRGARNIEGLIMAAQNTNVALDSTVAL